MKKPAFAFSMFLALSLSLLLNSPSRAAFLAEGAGAAGTAVGAAGTAAAATAVRAPMTAGQSVVTPLSAGIVASPAALAAPAGVVQQGLASAMSAAPVPVAAQAGIIDKKTATEASFPGGSVLQAKARSRIDGAYDGKALAFSVLQNGRRFDGSKPGGSDAQAGARALPAEGFVAPVRRPLAPAAVPAGANASQTRMLRTLYQIGSIFAENYMPLDLKKDNFHLDLKREYDAAKAAVLADPNITARGFQDIVIKFTSAMRDYHVSVTLDSTESATLHFQVVGAEGHYYLAYINREFLPEETFPFQEGDEIVSFDGRPTAEAVKAIADQKAGNTRETDMRFAELFLTVRSRGRGEKEVPQGTADLVISSQGQLHKVRMPWDYTPELVNQDVPPRNAGLLEPEVPGGAPAPGRSAGGFFGSVSRAVAQAAHPLIDLFAQLRAGSPENPFMIGSRKSFVPRLGEILWESGEDSHFHAYLFKDRNGRQMGYVRIASYLGGYEETREFAKLMSMFQRYAEGLVIDQVSNPGGSVNHVYALASHLTDTPLVTPHHRRIIGEDDATQAAQLLIQAKRDSERPGGALDREARSRIGKEPPNAGGYPITQKFQALMFRSARYILEQFNSGKRVTDYTYVGGVDEIDPAPNPEERYTGPILLLTNALDISGGDFFPAIMQDNRRAVIMGVRTAGAGGIVESFPIGQFGISSVQATTSLARRANGRPIENLGVTPDVPYELTSRDLRTAFAEYRLKILKTLDALVSAPTQPRYRR